EVVMTTGGVGTVQTVAALMAVVVAAAGPFLLMPLTRPVPDWLILVGVFAVTFALAKIVVDSGPLGHDEAVYAVKARAWLEGTPDTGWSIHRGIGQSVLAAAILPFSHSAEALRFLAAL